ncbi:MAG: hypothetical protein AAFX40_03485, partial [Cyanobacteria bacterium J06639_1]
MASEQSYPFQSARDAIVPHQADPLAAPSYYPNYGGSYSGGPQPDEPGSGGGGLGGILQVARRRWWIVLGIAAVVSAGAWWRALRLVPQYNSQFLMLVNISRDGAARSGNIPVEKQDPLSYSTLIQVLRSKLVLNPVVADLKDEYPNIGFGDLAGNLNIRLARDTDVLIVTYQNPNPERVKAVLDRVGAAYLDYGQTQARVNVQQGIDFVENKLPELRARTESLREQVKEFRQRYNIYDPDSRGGQLAAEIASIEQRQDTLEIDITASSATYERLQSQLGYENGETAPEVATAGEALSSSQEYQSLKSQIDQIDAEIKSERTRFAESSPMIQTLVARRQALEPLLQEAAATALRGRSGSGAQPLQGI